MPTRAYRNHNPGNIRHHSKSGEPYPVVRAFSGVDDGENYAAFPDNAQGCAALCTLISRVYNSYTVIDMMKKYAPATDGNDPWKYAKIVMKIANISSDKKIKELNPFEFFDLCKAITRFEGWKE